MYVRVSSAGLMSHLKFTSTKSNLMSSNNVITAENR